MRINIVPESLVDGLFYCKLEMCAVIISMIVLEPELYLQLHYSIVFLLRKENIYE